MTVEKKLYRDGPYVDLFCQGVQVGNALYISGQVGVNDEGVAPDDIVEQMKLAYGNVQKVLGEFNATMDNVVEETWFVTNVNDCMERVGELFSEREKIYAKKPEVCQTLIGVSALVDPSFEIEIKVVALFP